MIERFLEKYPGENVTFQINCSAMLAADETILGTPEMSALPVMTGADALQFEPALVNTESVTFQDRATAAAGKVVQVKIRGGGVDAKQPGRIYSVLATFTTNKGNTMVARVPMRVLSPAP